MSEIEVEFEYSDYDLPESFTPVEPEEALDYPDVEQQADPNAPQPLGFTDSFGVTPEQAIATARSWSLQGRWVGVGLCLATVQQYYRCPGGVPTAAASYFMSAHKRPVTRGIDVPRGAPVYWTGGSHGAGHIAISMGGGLCWSTDWKRQGRIDVARIDDITVRWGLQFRGYTWEVNGHQVWAPFTPIGTVHLSNLQPGKRNADVLKLKRRMKQKGYRGFLVTSTKFGPGITRAYAKYQSRLGFNGKDANGVPGTSSLEKLGFRVLP